MEMKNTDFCLVEDMFLLYPILPAIIFKFLTVLNKILAQNIFYFLKDNKQS